MSSFNCWSCGSEMIWGGDNMFEEVGMDGEGVTSNFSCSNCAATAEFHVPMSSEDVEDEKEVL